MTAHSRLWCSLLAWPTGLFLVVARMEIDDLTLPVFAALDLAYVAGLLVLLRAWDARGERRAAALVATGPGLFALVGFAGPPTADEPGLMMANTAVLLVVALTLQVVAIQIVLDHRASPHIPAVVPALLFFGIGTTVYLANLLARVAVVLAGAADQQAAVEDRAWVAFEYLRGLDGAPDHLSYLLVWFDLLQLGYVATAYVAFGAIVRLLLREDVVSPRVGVPLTRAAYALAAILVLVVAAAVALPRELDLVPAWAAFVTSIPFMTTLVPFGLGLAMLNSRAASRPSARAGGPRGRATTQAEPVDR